MFITSAFPKVFQRALLSSASAAAFIPALFAPAGAASGAAPDAPIAAYTAPSPEDAHPIPALFSAIPPGARGPGMLWAAWDDPGPAAPPAPPPSDSIQSDSIPSDSIPSGSRSSGPPEVQEVHEIHEIHGDTSGSMHSRDSTTDATTTSAPPAIPPGPRPAPWLSPTDTPRALVLLPLAIEGGSGEVAGPGPDPARTALAEAALRLGLAEAGLFRPRAREAPAALPGHGPRGCFDARCLYRAARRDPSAWVLAAVLRVESGRMTLRLALARAPGDTLTYAMRYAPRLPYAYPDSLLPAMRAAGRLLGAAPPGEGQAAGAGGAGAAPDADWEAAHGPWRRIAWLNGPDAAHRRARAAWSGLGLLAAGAAFAYSQDQLPGADRRSAGPSQPTAPDRGGLSHLRGFFNAPALGARYAAMGGAGMAAVADGLSPLLNPAGAAGAGQDDLILAKRDLPDGTPSFFVGYAGPLPSGWGYAFAARYQGDRLAGETTLYGDLACDLGAFLPGLDGLRAGLQAKIYLAQAGEEGTGLERSTGRSQGMGFDAGIQAPLTDRLTAAVAVRDAFGFLRHRNEYTDRSYGEILPAEWSVGAAYRAGGGLTLLLDGRKGVFADQADHLRAGGERTLWGFLAVRAGLHEVYGRRTSRWLSAGFGLDTKALAAPRLRARLALDYAYEFGMDADAPLAGGQQFSLRAGF